MRIWELYDIPYKRSTQKLQVIINTVTNKVKRIIPDKLWVLYNVKIRKRTLHEQRR